MSSLSKITRKSKKISPYAKGRRFELKTVQELIKLGFKKVDAFTGAGKEYMHLGGKNDKGRDILCQVAGVTFVIQCKNWTGSNKINREITYAHCEVTRRCAKHYKSVAIGIIVAPSMSAFTPSAIKAAETADDLILLSAIDKLRLHATVNSRNGTFTHFRLP
ncbi:hypothetical protein F8M41_021607 [Gigaspora margarita]|uniref:Restriction endonuclease type IV Mrr domain-containing protein n=1 Tax=Gigaspora margarita TaxID=4874 RepID=A0A8H4AGH7_GIGMA|nr:hypothetical protein F8M41_021607 [Gigaspora margarita]